MASGNRCYFDEYQHNREHAFRHHQRRSFCSNPGSDRAQYCRSVASRSLCSDRRFGNRPASPGASHHAVPWQREHRHPGPWLRLFQAIVFEAYLSMFAQSISLWRPLQSRYRRYSCWCCHASQSRSKELASENW